jgi:hypothetical protein
MSRGLTLAPELACSPWIHSKENDGVRGPAGDVGMESFLGSTWAKTLPSLALLAAALGAGVVIIASLRRRLLPASRPSAAIRAGNGRHKMGESGRGDWENMLAGCKNLRDEGVLSEEEFRKVRTLVEPRLRFGVPELRARHWPPTDPAGPEAARK